MNVANVIPLSAPHAVPYTKSGHRAALNPVRVRFDAFELDEPNALLLRDGKAVTLAPKPFGVLCALAPLPRWSDALRVRLGDGAWGWFGALGVLAALVLSIAALVTSASSPFIYFRF